MSLPVKMFEPRSTLQRIIDCFAFAPHYLKRASLEDDPLERLKLVITTSIAGMHLCTG